MARGWESKAVEEQIEAKPDSVSTDPGSRSPDEVHQAIEKGNLELARAKVLHALERNSNPRYARMLNQALSELDQKIASFK